MIDKRFLRGALFAGLACSIPAAAQHTNPLCWDAPRIFAASADETRHAQRDLKSILTIDRVKAPLPSPFELSSDKAYAFHLQQAAITGMWSGATRSEVLIFVEEPTLLRLTFSPVWSVQEVHWVNERLLFLRVWTGRARAMDLLVDVEKGTIVYRQPVVDGAVLQQQAKESCRVLKSDPVCHPDCRTIAEPSPNPSLRH